MAWREAQRSSWKTLLYGILYNDGYVGVTGDVGTGKTTLASALMKGLGDQVIAVKVPFPVDNSGFLQIDLKGVRNKQWFSKPRFFSYPFRILSA